MANFVLRKHTHISISISRTILLTCFVFAKMLLIVILPTSAKTIFIGAFFQKKNGFSIQRQKFANTGQKLRLGSNFV